MLNPTESPPPSRAPRFAPSITPPPPPVTTAQPASPNLRPTSRAHRYGLLPSSTRADPKSATAGRSMRATISNPARNSSAIFATDASMSDVPSSRILRSSVTRSESVLRDVRRDHADRERGRRAEVEDVCDRRFRAAPAEPQPLRRAPHRATVEEAERNEVEQVEEEPEVREREPEVGALRLGDQVTGEGCEAAEDRTRDRDAHRLPRVAARVLHVRAEERNEHRQLRVEPLALRLDVVPHLVEEDQQHDTDAEFPAPDQR